MLNFQRFNETVGLLLGLFVFLVMLTIWLSGIGAAMVLIIYAVVVPIITTKIVDPIRTIWRRHVKPKYISYYKRIRKTI